MENKRKLLEEISRRSTSKDEAIINLVLKHKLYNYLDNNIVSADVSDKIVASHNVMAIEKLLKSSNILSDWAQKTIFNEYPFDVVKLLLQRNQPLCDEIEEALLIEADDDLINCYIEHHSFKEAAEKTLLKDRLIGILYFYIQSHKLSPAGELEVIKHPNLLCRYLTYNSLSIEAFNEFIINYAYPEAINLLLQKKMKADEEYVFVKHAQVNDIGKYIKHYKFTNIDDIVEILLKRGFFDEVVSIIKATDRCFNARTEAEILNAPTLVVMAYIEKHSLKESQQLQIVKRGNTDEIIKLAQHNFVQPPSQMAILERENSQEIIALLENHQTCNDFQKALIERGIPSEIFALCSTNTLFSNVQNALIGRGVDVEITTYINRRELDNQAFLRLLTEKTNLVSCYIQRYLLNDYQLKKFVELASDSDIELYLNLYYPD